MLADPLWGWGPPLETSQDPGLLSEGWSELQPGLLADSGPSSSGEGEWKVLLWLLLWDQAVFSPAVAPGLFSLALFGASHFGSVSEAGLLPWTFAEEAPDPQTRAEPVSSQRLPGKNREVDVLLTLVSAATVGSSQL